MAHMISVLILFPAYLSRFFFGKLCFAQTCAIHRLQIINILGRKRGNGIPIAIGTLYYKKPGLQMIAIGNQRQVFPFSSLIKDISERTGEIPATSNHIFLLINDISGWIRDFNNNISDL